ncbi:hypothetical protein HAX54_029601 [Datura stramonium]|uniref:Protein kinase domain-containing protein n=1 Tax=Datura stramonium TaxID=4076 RepID=A0ABS8V7J8_DATST|nr:hypothetical protein [Datura stramonium]
MAIIVAAIYLLVFRIWHPSLLNKHRLVKCQSGIEDLPDEFISGGTLHDVLHQRKPPVVLDWQSRHRIALGIAQGLSYLHHDSVPQIDPDLKSNNVSAQVLKGWRPKIGDFGIAKIVSDYDENSTNSKIVGTLGYIAPENAYSYHLTEKSDVYSYGVLLLELFCRKMPVDPSFEEGLDIVFWVRKNLQRSSNNFLCFLDEEINLWDVDEQWKALKIVDLALQVLLKSRQAPGLQ